jgi:hypothetical protein
MYTKTKQGTTIFYDSVTQEPLFEAPIGESICLFSRMSKLSHFS